MPKSRRKIAIPDRYTETGKKFRGGFGEVVVLHDSLLDRDVALKVIHSAGDEDQLRNEINAMSEVYSKHVLRIYDLILDESSSVTGVIEEFLPGTDLTTFSETEAYDPRRFLRAAYQIASGIADIHARGLVHRDIKLNNMKTDAEGLIKLFDFGLSCAADDHETVASRATLVYAAPEYYDPPLVITHAVDTYAFGVCCWLLVIPRDKLPAPLIDRPPLKSGPAPSLASIAGGLSPELVGLLDSTLHKNPTLRPPMGMVRDEIARHLLRGQHRAWLSGGYVLNTPGQTVYVGNDTVGKITVHYDGLRFTVVSLTGHAYVNNRLLNVGSELPGSCVITIGHSGMGPQRTFVEFNVSHPEVVL